MPIVESSFQTQFGAEVPHMTPTSMALKTTVLCRAKSTLNHARMRVQKSIVHGCTPNQQRKNVFFRCFLLHELKHIQSAKVDSTCRSGEWSNSVMYGSLCRFLWETSSFHHIFLHMQPTHYLLPLQKCITVNGDNVLSSLEKGGRLEDLLDSHRFYTYIQAIL